METTPTHLADEQSVDPSTTPPPQRFQILALDGGGVKALFTAHVLARLEDDLGISIRASFDLIAGTSAGGIIALGLGAGLSPREIADQYETLARTVFPARRRRNLLRRLMRTTYSPGPLSEALESVVGDKLLGDSDKRLIIPAWNLQRQQVHIFKTRHHPRYSRDHKIPMVDVALATSAAPTFLPAAKVDGLRLIDGGIWANNPSVIAIVEATSALNIPLSAIRVLNVGTTTEVVSPPSRLDNGGLMQWAAAAAGLIVKASTSGAVGTAQHLVGSNNYVRFDAQVPGGLYALDSIDADSLAGLASGTSRDLSPMVATAFSGHKAEPFVPDPHPTKETTS